MPRRSVSDAEMKDTLVAADVFVILSQRYAWGLAPLEAIASGTPVILTPGAGCTTSWPAAPACRWWRPRIRAARRTRSAAGARATVVRASRTTRTWLREEYALDRYVERMEEIYESVRPGGAPDRRLHAAITAANSDVRAVSMDIQGKLHAGGIHPY